MIVDILQVVSECRALKDSGLMSLLLHRKLLSDHVATF